MAAYQARGPVVTNQRERLQAELDELQRRFDNLTSRIRAVDTDLGRVMDSEHRFTLEERREELASLRKKTAARMVQVEAPLAEIAKPEPQIAQVVEPEPAIKRPASPVRTEPQPVAKVVPGQTVLREFLTIGRPIHLELIRIPAGEFLMGHDKTPVDVTEFYIGKYPVTNQQYEAFVQANDYELPQHLTRGRTPAGKENHPVTFVSWDDTLAFYKWLSKETERKFRLPTESEWVKAARGGLRIPGPGGAQMDNPLPNRQYPWGGKFDAGKCNTYESGIRDTTPVGKYSSAGDSPYGVADMTGNVWEWTQEHVLRGGSWYGTHSSAASAFRGRGYPNYRSFNVGLRVVVVGWPPNA